MRINGVRLTPHDYGYVILACIAGVWQWLCFDYGRDNVLTAVLILLMGLPFALLTYLRGIAGTRVAQSTDWTGAFKLWAGMPISIVAGGVAIGSTTILISARHPWAADPPLSDIRLILGEAVACLTWAKFLQISLPKTNGSLLRLEFAALFAALLLAVLLAYGLSGLVHRFWHKDLFFLFTSIIVTAVSALMLSTKMAITELRISA